jgi:hypothetical protein
LLPHCQQNSRFGQIDTEFFEFVRRYPMRPAMSLDLPRADHSANYLALEPDEVREFFGLEDGWKSVSHLEAAPVVGRRCCLSELGTMERVI